jgi:hypothetical protein
MKPQNPSAKSEAHALLPDIGNLSQECPSVVPPDGISSILYDLGVFVSSKLVTMAVNLTKGPDSFYKNLQAVGRVQSTYLLATACLAGDLVL